jgi:hypothetical protein
LIYSLRALFNRRGSQPFSHAYRHSRLAIAVASLAVLFRWKVSNPLLIAANALIGLIAFPLPQPAWVMVK